MTGDRRIERELPRILTELGSGGEPDYTDSLLARTAAVRQRPGWVFLERWLPMHAVSERVIPPRVPLRAIVTVALIVIVIAVSAALIASSLQRRLPAPYGPADNGLVVYDFWATGDIYVGDPVLGDRRQITSGPEFDSAPGFSRDGTRLAFLRSESADALDTGKLMIVDADGSWLHQVTGRTFAGVSDADWSGDGDTIALVSRVDTRQMITLVDVESGTTRDLQVGPDVVKIAFRPPGDDEVLFVGDLGGGVQVLSVIGTSAARPREILRSPTGELRPLWSPDGTRIAYSRVGEDAMVRTHVVDPGTGVDKKFQNPPGVIYQLNPVWSPDGTSLLVGRGAGDTEAHACCPEPNAYALGIIPVDGSDTVGREVDVTGFSFGSGWDWSPDGTKIVTSHDSSFTSVDLTTGEEKTYDGWLSGVWQRVKR